MKAKHIVVYLLLAIVSSSCIREEALNAEADILSCILPGVAMTTSPIINNNSITIFVGPGTDISELKPEFTLTPGAAISPLSGTERNFNTPQEYTVTAADGVWKKMYTVSVIDTELATNYNFEDTLGGKKYYIFVEREGDKVVMEWGYINQVDSSKNPKYLTNMYITDSREDFSEEANIKKEVAKFLCEKFFKDLFEKFDKAEDNWGMICPNNDKNYLKYNLVMMALSSFGNVWENWEELAVKRPDGGNFIAYATVTDDCVRQKADDKYAGCGYMYDQVWRDNKQVLQSKQYNCIYSDRKIDWRSNIQEDWEDLYSYLSNGCDKEKISVSSFSNLSAKGYIADGENQVTVINVKDGNLVNVINNFVANHIHIPEFIFEEGKKVDERLYEVNKSKYPEHLEKLVRYNNSNAFTWGEFIPYIVEIMLEVGMLKPLTQKQKKAVFTVVAIDCR